MSTPSSALVVISETELLSAEILGNRLQFSGTVIPVEDNKFKKEPLVEMSLNILPEDQIKVSLPTIGFIAPDTAFPIVVDFFQSEMVKLYNLHLKKQQLLQVLFSL